MSENDNVDLIEDIIDIDSEYQYIKRQRDALVKDIKKVYNLEIPDNCSLLECLANKKDVPDKRIKVAYGSPTDKGLHKKQIENILRKLRLNIEDIGDTVIKPSWSKCKKLIHDFPSLEQFFKHPYISIKVVEED